jgi:hypothetical protein
MLSLDGIGLKVEQRLNFLEFRFMAPPVKLVELLKLGNILLEHVLIQKEIHCSQGDQKTDPRQSLKYHFQPKIL